MGRDSDGGVTHAAGSPGITGHVRAAGERDVTAIAALVADALGDKVRPAFGARAVAGVAALARRDLSRRSVRYLVAEEGGEVVGAARLAVGQEASPEGLGPLARDIGRWGALRAAIVLGLLTHSRLSPGEAYLEQLAVRADRRRRGLGDALVAACEDTAVSAGRRRVTLWVTEGNQGALALYLSRGYRVIRRRTTWRGRVLYGAPVALLMQKDLPSREVR